MPESLDQLVMSRRVLIVVGAGGVGKTTTAAALAIAAARRGRRVLCMTIDPARRLAEALGLERMTPEEQRVSWAPAPGEPPEGTLTAVMLDQSATFDELVLKYSPSPERAKRLLSNKLYQYVSRSLAGTQEYMAMEKLATVQKDPRFDLIVLDTPPTTNALDFLDAPERLVEALDSPAIRWFVQAFESTGKLSFNLLARSAIVVLRGLGRITGGQFLRAMAEFISELDDLFGGFRERAKVVEAELRSPEVTFVLATSPAPMSIREVLYFSERLRESNMPRGALVVNRFHRPPPSGDAPPVERDVAGAIASHGLRLGDGAPQRLLAAYADALRLSALDAMHVRSLDDLTGRSVPIVRIPELPSDIHDLNGLAELSDLLMRGGI